MLLPGVEKPGEVVLSLFRLPNGDAFTILSKPLLPLSLVEVFPNPLDPKLGLPNADAAVGSFAFAVLPNPELPNPELPNPELPNPELPNVVLATLLPNGDDVETEDPALPKGDGLVVWLLSLFCNDVNGEAALVEPKLGLPNAPPVVPNGELAGTEPNPTLALLLEPTDPNVDGPVMEPAPNAGFPNTLPEDPGFEPPKAGAPNTDVPVPLDVMFLASLDP